MVALPRRRHRRLKYAGGTKSYRSLSPSHLTTFARSPEISRRSLPSFINSNARLKIGAAGTISPDHRVHNDPQAARDPSRAAGLCAPQGIRGVVRQLGGLAQSGKTATAAKGGAGRSASARRSIPTRSKRNGYVGSLEEAKRQFQNAWTSWLEWADLQGAAGLIRGPNDYRCSSSSSAWRFSPLSPQGLSDRGRSGFWRLGLL